MACPAKFVHDQGHGSNMEGPHRLLVPASLGGVGICRRSEEGRICSRKSLNGDKTGGQKESNGVLDPGDIYRDKHIYGHLNGKHCVNDAIAAEVTNVDGKVSENSGGYLARQLLDCDANVQAYVDDATAAERTNNENLSDGPPGFGCNADDKEEQLAGTNLYAGVGQPNGVGKPQRYVLAFPHRAVRPEDFDDDRERQAMANNANALGHDGGCDRKQYASVIRDRSNENFTHPSGRLHDDLHGGSNLLDKAFVADEYDLHVKGRGRLLNKQDIDLANVNMVVPLDDPALASNFVDGYGCEPRALVNRDIDYNARRGGDREQVGLVENDHVVSPKCVMENQSRQTSLQMGREANRVSLQLEIAIEDVNNMLLAVGKDEHIIPLELVQDMKNHLTQAVHFLAGQFEHQVVVIEQLVGTRTTLEREVVQLNGKNQQLLNQLAIEKRESSGLSTAQVGKLKLLGISNVDDLINKYRHLQDQAKYHESLSRTTSKLSLAHDCPSGIRSFGEAGNEVVKNGGSLQDSKVTLAEDHRLRKPSFPKPQSFKGKTRVELERFFRYFEPYADSLSLNDNEKALMVGYYLPNLQYQHDSLMQRKASYIEVKRELLNALGSDSSVATYSLRASLDKLTKPPNKSYRKLFEEVERKVAEAYGADQSQREQELKKILIRLTQEDADTSFSSTIIPHTANDYYRLKELVLGTEDAIKLRMQTVKKSSMPEYKSFGSPDMHCEDVGSPRKMHNNDWRQKLDDSLHRKPIANEVSPTKSFASASFSCKRDHVVLHCCHRPWIGFIRKCYTCRKPGHEAKDCPNGGNAQMAHEISQLKYSDEVHQEFMISGISPVNNICMSSSNPQEYCTSSGSHQRQGPCFRKVNSKVKSRKTCFVCGKINHLARECSLRHGASKLHKSNERSTPELASEENCLVGAIEKVEKACKLSREATADVDDFMSRSKAMKSLALSQEPIANSSKGCVELECRGQSLVNVNRSKCNSADYPQPSENCCQPEKYGAVNFNENCSLLYRALLCFRENVSNMAHGKKRQHQQQCRSTLKKFRESNSASIQRRDLQSLCKCKKSHLNAHDLYEYRARASPKSNVKSCSRHEKPKSCHQSMKCINYGRAECPLQSENQINSKKSIHYRGR